MKNGAENQHNEVKKIDQEDENREDEIEKFENAYNMRFEDT